MTPNERHVLACAMRQSCKNIFDSGYLDLHARDEPWIHPDSYDAGLLAGVRYFLRLADEIEGGTADKKVVGWWLDDLNERAKRFGDERRRDGE